MIEMKGKPGAYPLCEREATVHVHGEGPRRDTGELMRVEFGVCEAHEGATCDRDGCENFPSHAATDDSGQPQGLTMCAACSRSLLEASVVTIDGRTKAVKVEDGRLFLQDLPTTRPQG